MSLIRLWALVNDHYGKIVAGLAVAGVIGFAWYFGYTPSQVIGFFGK